MGSCGCPTFIFALFNFFCPDEVLKFGARRTRRKHLLATQVYPRACRAGSGHDNPGGIKSAAMLSQKTEPEKRWPNVAHSNRFGPIFAQPRWCKSFVFAEDPRISIPETPLPTVLRAARLLRDAAQQEAMYPVARDESLKSLT
jgi:hypothetical protein